MMRIGRGLLQGLSFGAALVIGTIVFGQGTGASVIAGAFGFFVGFLGGVLTEEQVHGRPHRRSSPGAWGSTSHDGAAGFTGLAPFDNGSSSSSDSGWGGGWSSGSDSSWSSGSDSGWSSGGSGFDSGSSGGGDSGGGGSSY